MSDAGPRTADRHPGAYSAGLAFDRQRSFAAANSLGIVVVLVVAALASIALVFWLPGPSAVRGFAAGVFLAATVGYLAHWVSVASGSTSAAMGQAAEEWTATELRRLRRRGWKHVNSVMFRQWDIDHIAVGPNGVIVIETKWRSDPIDLTDPDQWLLDAADRLHRNERDVALHLGWSAAKQPDAWITSVLVVWGPRITQPSAQPLRSDRGVNVLAGEHLRQNLADLTEQVLSSSEVDEIIAKLEVQARSRDQAESPSWRTVQTRAHRGLVCAVVAFIAAYVSLLSTRLGWGYFAAAAVLAVAGAIGATNQRYRPWALSWLTGTLVVTIGVSIAIAYNLAGGS